MDIEPGLSGGVHGRDDPDIFRTYGQNCGCLVRPFRSVGWISDYDSGKAYKEESFGINGGAARR